MLSPLQPLPQLDAFVSLMSAFTSAPATTWVGTHQFAGHHSSVLEKSGSHESVYQDSSSFSHLSVTRSLMFSAVGRSQQSRAAPMACEALSKDCPWRRHPILGITYLLSLLLPTALPRSWGLCLLTLLNSKGVPEITQSFQMARRLCSVLRTRSSLHTARPR